jgi:DNA polymerase III subunit alpha
MDKFITGAMANGLSEGNAVKVWKQLVTAGAYAFNAAHCVSYGMLAYWTMWLKQNHPLEFYCAALQKYDPKTKGFDLLKEANAKGIPILPPSPTESGYSWEIDYAAGGLRAGFTQVAGIGPKTAQAMMEYRDAYEVVDWQDFTAVKGIGPATMAKVEEFVSQPDPFGLNLMSETLSAVRRWIWEEGMDVENLPMPRSKSEDVPYEAIKGEHVWLGVVRERNLKDIYELHRSRTGEELDPDSVREPQYVNYVVMTGEDETGPLHITVHRFRGLYEHYKDAIWNMDIKRDLLLVKGYKRAEYRRAIYATEVYVINPERIL